MKSTTAKFLACVFFLSFFFFFLTSTQFNQCLSFRHWQYSPAWTPNTTSVSYILSQIVPTKVKLCLCYSLVHNTSGSWSLSLREWLRKMWISTFKSTFYSISEIWSPSIGLSVSKLLVRTLIYKDPFMFTKLKSSTSWIQDFIQFTPLDTTS